MVKNFLIMELIDKSTIVAEIEKRIKKYVSIDVGGNEIYEALYGAKCKALIEILSFLNTLEMKEVDLEKEIKDYIHALPHAKTGVPNGWRLSWHEDEVMKIAKHFFELGMKVSNKTKKDVSYVKIDRKVLFEMCDAILNHDGYADRDDCPENDSPYFVDKWDSDFRKKVENIRNNS